jgi:hypothetical protein
MDRFVWLLLKNKTRKNQLTNSKSFVNFNHMNFKSQPKGGQFYEGKKEKREEKEAKKAR